MNSKNSKPNKGYYKVRRGIITKLRDYALKHRITPKLFVLIPVIAALIIVVSIILYNHFSTTKVIASIEGMDEEELAEFKRTERIDAVLEDYGDLGVVDTTGYINVRSSPDSSSMVNIVGKAENGAALDILEESGEWLRIHSGDVEGYVNKEYIIRGEDARLKAEADATNRAIIDTNVLNIRSAPEINPGNVIGKARKGERYKYISTDGNWAKISLGEGSEEEGIDDSEGYLCISDDTESFLHIDECLNVAKKVDLRQMALTQYDNMVLAFTNGYINIRKDPSDKGIDNICGKFQKGSGAELLDTVNNDAGTWYKIKSGPVTGYVSAKYCLTGNEAKNAALDYTTLTAYINVDALNVRNEASLDAKAWTKVTKNQAYSVLNQIDDWVEIELDQSDDEGDSDRAFISTRDNNVDVRYGLTEAIEYYPAVEAANAAAAFRNKIVNFACQYVGNPYVWGGTSLTKGCDCSGFTLRVFEHFGIGLPRTSREQAKVGTKVTSQSMKPGDLIFYANKGGTVNHVGIYIGNGQVVNAASTKSGIKIYRWNYRSPVAIRNIIGK